VTSDFAYQESATTTQNVSAVTSGAAITATSARPAPVSAPPSWAWRRGALILAGAAQLITISVSQLAARARRLKVVVVTDAGYLAQIRETASLAKSATVPEVVVNHVREPFAGLLDLDGARFEYGVLLGHPPRLEPDGTVTVGHSRWDVELSDLPAQEIELRTFGNGQYYGRFMPQARPGSRSPLQARLVAVTLAGQAGQTFGVTRTARSVS
jgi:hypothetical protein